MPPCLCHKLHARCRFFSPAVQRCTCAVASAERTLHHIHQALLIQMGDVKPTTGRQRTWVWCVQAVRLLACRPAGLPAWPGLISAQRLNQPQRTGRLSSNAHLPVQQRKRLARHSSIRDRRLSPHQPGIRMPMLTVMGRVGAAAFHRQGRRVLRGCQMSSGPCLLLTSQAGSQAAAAAVAVVAAGVTAAAVPRLPAGPPVG